MPEQHRTLNTNGIGHMNMFDYFNSIYFTDSNTGYITDGSKNFIFKTTNAGGTWTPIGTDHGFSSVFFPAANIGYSLSWRVEKTMDAGVNWTDLYKGTNETLRSVSFPSATTGYAVGSADVEQPRTIIKTIDGGTNWTILSSGPQYEWLNSVFFTDVNTGYILDNQGDIYKTMDGGGSWTTLQSGQPGSFKSVFFTDANTGYVVGNTYGDSGIILKTNDAGATWIPTTVNFLLNFVYFPDALTGYSAGYAAGNGKGAILKTTDAGASWNVSLSGASQAFNSIYFKDVDIGYAVGMKVL